MLEEILLDIDDIFRDPELESIHTLGWPKGSFRIPQMNLLANPKY